jgi:hypothetical protein
MPSPVTAVGRLLRPRNGEPRRHRVVAVRPDGSVRTVIDRIIPSTPAAATAVDQSET